MNTNTSGVIKGGSLAVARRQGGFTLNELVIVLAVLGALAAIAVPQLTGLQADARLNGTATSISSEAGNQFANDLLNNENLSNWTGSGVCTYINDATVDFASTLDGYELGSGLSGDPQVAVTVPTYDSGSEEVGSTECILVESS